MLPSLKTLWQDQRGVVTSGELVLMSTILLIGMIVGLTTLRDQVVQEFGDAALSVGALDQTYSFAGTMFDGNQVAGSDFTDFTDFCDGTDPGGAEPACISVQQAPTEEGP